MRSMPRLLGLATAVPPYALDQEEVVEHVKRLFGRSAMLDRLLPVFANSGIRRRYSTVPLDWYDEPHGWAERNRRYVAGALDLLESVAGRALDTAGIAAGELGGIVTVSTTGIATPSLDVLLIERMRLPRTLARLPIFGLGCAGGVIGLARAAEMAAALPGKAVLCLVVELCTLSFRRGETAKSNIVATALFGDGAAAAVVTSGHHSLARITGSAEKLWPDTLRIMGWDVEDSGLAVVFDRAIPPFIEEELAQAVDEMCASMGIAREDVGRLCSHPGGVKVIDAIESALHLNQGELNLEREVLRDYGNMSAPTVLFVLERLLEQGLPDKTMMTAFGPGFTCAALLLEAS
jgi:alkylresorcinol/alkylpyrone synthase